MVTVSKQKLSGSTNGRPIGLNTSANTTIHTANNTAGYLDEVWIYASNAGSANNTLTLNLGGTSTADILVVNIQNNDSVLVIPGIPMDGGVVISAKTSANSQVAIFGFVNRINQN